MRDSPEGEERHKRYERDQRSNIKQVCVGMWMHHPAVLPRLLESN